MYKILNLIKHHRYDIFFSLILLTILIILFFVLPTDQTKSIIKSMENKTFDIRQNVIASKKKTSKDIVIVTVDDPSYEYLIETYGDWPIPRKVYAEVLDYIQAQNPKFVLFDLLFVQSLKRIPGSDEKLVDAFKKYNNTYTAINFDDYSAEIRKPPVLDMKFASDVENNSSQVKPQVFKNCRLIMKELMQATDKIGHVNTPKSDDGFIRTIPLIVTYPRFNKNDMSVIKDEYYLYMTLKMAIDYLNTYENQNISTIKIDKNNNMLLGNKKIPLTEKAETILNWYGESGIESDKTFHYVSFWEVLKSQQSKLKGEKEILPPNIFEGKIVYIGTNIFSLSDIKTVPTSKYLPGVEIHATLMNNILDNNLIHKASVYYNILITLIIVIASAYTVFRIRSVYASVILFFSLVFLYLYFSAFVMAKYNVWVWVVVPLLSAVIVFVSSFIIKYLIKSRDFEYTYKLATTDGLTELYNHRFFQEQMKNKIEFAQKNKSSFSLIMIDIDFFKKFNDKYGHQAGDAVLKHVAKTLKSCIRNEDMVCRYGGEEMTIILNNMSKENAVKTAQKICSVIASKDYELTPDLTVKITISLGTATFPENGKTPTELIEYADKCLYKAKENGRNQVGFID